MSDQAARIKSAVERLTDMEGDDVLLPKDEALALLAERNGCRAALQRIADNTTGLTRRAATQALEGLFDGP